MFPGSSLDFGVREMPSEDHLNLTIKKGGKLTSIQPCSYFRWYPSFLPIEGVNYLFIQNHNHIQTCQTGTNYPMKDRRFFWSSKKNGEILTFQKEVSALKKWENDRYRRIEKIWKGRISILIKSARLSIVRGAKMGILPCAIESVYMDANIPSRYEQSGNRPTY